MLMVSSITMGDVGQYFWRLLDDINVVFYIDQHCWFMFPRQHTPAMLINILRKAVIERYGLVEVVGVTEVSPLATRNDQNHHHDGSHPSDLSGPRRGGGGGQGRGEPHPSSLPLWTLDPREGVVNAV